MTYNRNNNLFEVEIFTQRKNTQFKFIINGEYKTSEMYKVARDQHYQNNVLFYSRTGMSIMSSIDKSKSETESVINPESTSSSFEIIKDSS